MSKRTDRILDQWYSYRDAVIPGDAPEVQIRESKRAFYGGAVAMFQLVSKATELEEDAACLILEKLSKEMRDFHKSVGKGN